MRADKQGSSSRCFTPSFISKGKLIFAEFPPQDHSRSSSSLSRSFPVQVQRWFCACSALGQLRLLQGDRCCLTWLCCSAWHPPQLTLSSPCLNPEFPRAGRALSVPICPAATAQMLRNSVSSGFTNSFGRARLCASLGAPKPRHTVSSSHSSILDSL